MPARLLEAEEAVKQPGRIQRGAGKRIFGGSAQYAMWTPSQPAMRRTRPAALVKLPVYPHHARRLGLTARKRIDWIARVTGSVLANRDPE